MWLSGSVVLPTWTEFGVYTHHCAAYFSLFLVGESAKICWATRLERPKILLATSWTCRVVPLRIEVVLLLICTTKYVHCYSVSLPTPLFVCLKVCSLYFKKLVSHFHILLFFCTSFKLWFWSMNRMCSLVQLLHFGRPKLRNLFFIKRIQH